MLCFSWKFMDSVEEFIIWSYFDPKLLFWDKENIFSHEPLLSNQITRKTENNNRSYVFNSCIWNDVDTNNICLNNFCVYHCSYSLNHSPLDIKPSIGFLSCIKTRIYDVISKGSSECLWIQRIHTHTLNDTLHFFHLSLPKRNEKKKELWVYIVKGV